jgi:ABC-type phosphate transport system substrate-binding protein
MTSKFHRFAALAVGALLLGSIAPPGAAMAADGYKVIVHSSNPTTSLSRDDVMRYLLKKETAWPSGAEVSAVDLQKESATREVFSREVLHKSIAAVSAYWRQQVFSGRAVPPPEKRSDAEVVAFVAGNAGAIGYVSESADVGDAKVVRLAD